MLNQLTGGVAIKEFLNVELPKVQERRADLVAWLRNRSIFHLEIQSTNDRNMPYREGIYCSLLGQNYRCPVRQVVLYVGGRPACECAITWTWGKLCSVTGWWTSASSMPRTYEPSAGSAAGVVGQVRSRACAGDCAVGSEPGASGAGTGGGLAPARGRIKMELNDMGVNVAQQLDQATPAQLDRWVEKMISASTLDGVLGPR